MNASEIKAFAADPIGGCAVGHESYVMDEARIG